MTERSVENETRPDRFGQDAFSGASLRPTVRTYRALLLTPDGRIATSYRLDAQDDAEAIARATSMVDGHAVELWDGVRFIEHFPSAD